MLAPAGTPQPIVAKLAAAVGTALKDPEVTVAFSALGLEPAGEGPEALAMTIRANVAQWQDVVERAGFNQN
jgi:tripartite-type tricarboxylate transporter receptor subunit TctC